MIDYFPTIYGLLVDVTHLRTTPLMSVDRFY